MPRWINGGGFYLVQPTEPYSAEKIRIGMEELELKIQLAERLIEERRQGNAV